MKDYKITTIKVSGRKKKRIRIVHKRKVYVDLSFDDDEETKNIKSADLTILKENLPFNTKIIKPIK